MERLSDKLLSILNEQDFCFTAEELRTVEKAIGVLSAYQDTGLEPEEITIPADNWCVFYCNRWCRLDRDWCAEGPGCPMETGPDKAEHLRELIQAEKDGRLVALPCKAEDMAGGDRDG